MTDDDRRKKQLKWARRFTFLAFLGVLCLPVALTQTDWGRERMRDLVVQVIHAELGLDASLGEVRVDLHAFPPEVVLSADDIVLDDPVYGRFAEAGALRIRPSFVALVQGKVDLDEIEVVRPAFHLIVRDGEVRNLPRTRTTGDGSAELPFSKLVVRDGRITVDAQPYADAELGDVDVTLHVTDGTRLALVVQATGGTIDHALGQERIERIVVEGRVDPADGIDLDYLLVRTPHLRVAAHDARVDLPFAHTYAGEVEVKVHLDHLRNLPVGVELPPLHGWVEAHANLNGTPEGPMGQSDVQLRDVHIEEYGLGETVDLALDFDPNEIRIQASEFDVVGDNGGVVRAEGSIGLRGEMPVDVDVEIDHLQFARLMEQLGVTPNAIVQWDLSGRASLAGTLSPLDLSGPIWTNTRDFLVTQGAWHEEPSERVISVDRARIAGSWSVRPDGLRFEGLRGETPHSRLSADVLLGFDNALGVRASSSSIDLEDITPLLMFEMGGRGTCSVDVSGTFSDPRVTGHFALADFAFGTFPMGDIESDMVMEKGGLAVRFPSVTAVKNDSRYRVQDLFLDFSDSRFVTTGRVVASTITLADVYHTFHYEDDERFEDYQATGSGTIDLRYTLGFPGDSETGTLVADLDMSMGEASFGGFAFTDGRFRGRWRWLDYEQGVAGGELDIWEMTLAKGAGTVTAAGRIALGERLQLTATADHVEVSDTEGFADRLPDLSGVWGLTAEVRGTLSVPRMDVDLGVTGLAWDGALLGDGRMYVRLTDKDDPWIAEARQWDPYAPPDEPCAHARAGFAHARWRADPPLRTADGPVPARVKPMAFVVCGDGAGGRVDLDMAFGWTSTYPLRGRLDLTEFPLDSVLRQTTGDEQVGGAITGHAYFNGGAMLEDDSLEGEVLLERFALAAGGVSLENDGDVDIILRGGEGFQVSRAIFAGAGSELRVSGTGLSHALALQVDGDVDLGLLASLSSTVNRAHGRLALRVNVTGSSANPAIFGEALVQDAGFNFATFPAPIDELNGRVSFSAHRVFFEDFTAQVAGGQLAFAGSAQLQDGSLGGYTFDVDARDMFLAPEDGVQVAFGGQTRLHWEPEMRLPLLTGRLVLDRVRYGRDVSLSPTIGEMNRAQRADVERYDPEEDMLAIDLAVETRRPISVANNLIDADIVVDDTEGAFRIVGTDQRYGVVGTLDIPRGFLKLRNNQLAIREARIDFVDETRVDPQFDVLATTEVRRTSDPTAPDWQITLRAHGNLDGFRLDLSSVPQMPQEDVLMLLTFGMTRTEAEQLQAGDLGGAGLEALSNVVGVNDEVTRAVGLIDEFGITSIYSEQTNRPEPHVTVGRRISDRVRLTGSTSLTSEDRDVRGSVVVQVDDQTSIEAGYDTANRETGSNFGNLGVDFRWRLEFD